MIRVAVHGSGRMAQAIAAAVQERDDVQLEAVVGRSQPDWDWQGHWFAQLDSQENLPDVLIDFTLPEGTRAAAQWCERHRVPLVSGVTGLGEDVMQQLRAAAGAIPVLWSPNLSLGVNLLTRLAVDAAAVVPADTAVHIRETHHQWKKDAPSGTALMLGGAIEKALLDSAREVSYESIREGEVIGDHSVCFSLAGETIELAHSAGDRSIYARGALNAGTWLVQQPAGLYSAADWLSGLLEA